MKNNQQGNSLIEVIIALAIFTWLASSMTSLVLGSLALVTSSANQTNAQMLAQEGLEISRSIRNRAWNHLSEKSTAVEAIANTWQFSGDGTSEQIGIFNRRIIIENVYRDSNFNIISSTSAGAILDNHTKKIISLVTWLNSHNSPSKVSYSSILSNWNSSTLRQDDWSGGGAQDIFLDNTKYLQQDGNIDDNISKQLELLEIASSSLASFGSLESSAFFMGENSLANSIVWQGDIPSECENCQISLQIKTAADSNGSPGTWSATWCGPEGEDGDESDYFLSSSSPEIVHPDHNNKQWIKYKVELEGDEDHSPSLKSVTINYKNE